MERFLSGLDEAQQKVARHFIGPAIVVAGPGAGKTKCLIHRVACLLTQDVRADQILAVTFTKNAAEEMNSRLDKLLTDDGRQWYRPSISTFHSFGYSLLRSHGWQDYTVIKKKKTMIIEVIKSVGLTTDKYLPEDVIMAVSNAKNALMSPTDLKKKLVQEDEDISPAILYEAYEAQKQKEHVLDFDDMLYYAWRMLANDRMVLQEYRKKFKFVMVDEAQDNSRAQTAMADLIAGPDGNLMLIGDDAQAIYGWRGAHIEFMLEFATRPGVTQLMLCRNYRSVKTVVAAANKLIENNEDRIEKELYTERPQGDAPVVVSLPDSRAEAKWVMEQIDASIKAGRSLKEMAVLYRANHQSCEIEDQLRRKGIPYVIYGSQPFFGRAEIRDLIAYLKLIKDAQDLDALQRVYMTPPRYLGKAWFNEFKQYQEAVGDIVEALEQGYSRAYMDRGARSLAGDLAKLRSMRNLTPHEIVTAITQIHGMVHPEKTLLQHYENPEETGSGEINSDRAENVVEFIELSKEYGTFEEFMAFLDKASEVKQDKESQLQSDSVKLMTIHRAKGLEFEAVWVVGCSEGMLPHRKSMDKVKIPEERRLAYVAITRAKDRVFCTHIEKKFGRYLEPSRFLFEAFEPEILGDLQRRMADLEAPEEGSTTSRKAQVLTGVRKSGGPWVERSKD